MVDRFVQSAKTRTCQANVLFTDGCRSATNLCSNIRAREVQADLLFDEILDIADGAKDDMINIQRARLQIDVRKWMVGKLAPKKYGKRVTKAITGNDGEGPAIIEVRWKEPGESIGDHE
jgi:hypothetical protein